MATATKGKNGSEAKKETDNRLCVVSADNYRGLLLSVSSLTYGNGKTRTYLLGRLDDRILPFKRKTTVKTLARHFLSKQSNNPVIAKVEHVKKLTGWKDRQFAPAE
jgi:hypothetical protein